MTSYWSRLAQKKFDGITAEIRENILDFYHAYGIGAEFKSVLAQN